MQHQPSIHLLELSSSGIITAIWRRPALQSPPLSLPKTSTGIQIPSSERLKAENCCCCQDTLIVATENEKEKESGGVLIKRANKK